MLTISCGPAFTDIHLRTARLFLRPFRASDAQSILALFQDDDFLKFSPAVPFTSISEAEALVARDIRQLQAGERLRLGLEPLDGGVVMGYCDLFNIDLNTRKGEIGFGLLTRHRRSGLMSEALAAFVRLLLTELHFNRLIAEIDPANTRSERVLRRLGFMKENHFRENCILKGELADSAFYGLLRRDLEASDRTQRTT